MTRSGNLVISALAFTKVGVSSRSGISRAGQARGGPQIPRFSIDTPAIENHPISLKTKGGKQVQSTL